MTRTIRLEHCDDNTCTMWADSEHLGKSPILLAEICRQNPPISLPRPWYWYPKSRVFSFWLSDAREVFSPECAKEIGEMFLRYLDELQEFLGVEE